MTNSQLTITTPNPWSDGFDEGEITITTKVSSGTKGSDLLAALSSPGTQHEDIGTHEVSMTVHSVFTAHQPADPAVRVLQVPNPALSGVEFNFVPESSTNSALIGILLMLGLVSRRFRRR